ncbi:hypothetical protein FHS31_000321 [Sphingomonas vulcanisoli]|uniref:MBG domain-containing protein n=1 Tax=Sphingomonas vulcanisoli TaxID=1658060 RepID=A0ABX0TRH4_9SPHN|nr:hypothetical protein [Sphingomonas vulcanisoli]
MFGAVTFTGLVGADAVAGTHGLAITDRSNAGTYSDTLSGLTGAASANYVLATGGNTAGMYTINPKMLGYSLIAANTNQSITYLDTAKSFGTLTGVVAGDSVAPTIIAINSTSSFLYDPNSMLAAGSWSFSFSPSGAIDRSWALNGASAANYVLPLSALPSGIIGAVTVAKKPVTYTTTAPSTGVYGDTIGYSFTLSGVPTGYMNQVSVVPLLDGKSFDSSQAAFTAGTHQIGATLNSANFVMSGGTASPITITQRPLTATLNSASAVYGSTISDLLTITNIARNDAVLPVISMAGQSYTLGKQTIGYGLSNLILDAGTRSFTITGLSGSLAGNYTITTIVGTGQLIVTPKPLTWSVAAVQGQYGGISSLAPYNGCSYASVCYLGTQANFGPGSVTLTGVINNDAVSGNILIADGVSAQPYSLSLAPGTYAQVVGSLSGAKAGNYSLAASGNTAGAMTIAPGVVQVNVSGGGRIYDNGDRTTYQAIGTPGVISAVRSTNYPGTPVTGFLPGDDVGVLVTVYQNGQPYTGGTNFATGTYEFRPIGLIGSDAYKYKMLPISGVGSSSGTFVVSDSSVFNFSFLSATPNVAYTPPASVTTFQANATGSGSGSATTTQTALSFAAQASGSGSGSASVSYGPLSITASASASAATLASFGVTGITLSASAGAHAAVTLAIGPASMTYGADGSASATASLGTGGLTLTTLASADAYQNLTVGGDLGSGVSGSSSSTARVFADAGSTNSATYANGTIVVSEKQWAGVGASVGTSGTISGGGVSGSASITVYSPGSLGIGASSTSGYSDGTVTIGFSLGISIGIGGLEIAPSFSFDTKPIVNFATGIGNMISDMFTGGGGCDSSCQAANAAAAKAADVQNKYNTALQMFQKAGDKPTVDLMNYVAQNPEVAQKLDELKFNSDQDRFNLSRAVSTYGSVPAQLNSVVAQEQALVQKIQSNPGSISPGDLLQAQSLRDQEASLIAKMKALGGTVQVANGKIGLVASK